MEVISVKTLELIGTALVLGIVAVVIIALVRPEKLETITSLVKAIITVIVRRNVDVEVKTTKKPKKDDGPPQ